MARSAKERQAAPRAASLPSALFLKRDKVAGLLPGRGETYAPPRPRAVRTTTLRARWRTPPRRSRRPSRTSPSRSTRRPRRPPPPPRRPTSAAGERLRGPDRPAGDRGRAPAGRGRRGRGRGPGAGRARARAAAQPTRRACPTASARSTTRSSRRPTRSPASSRAVKPADEPVAGRPEPPAAVAVDPAGRPAQRDGCACAARARPGRGADPGATGGPSSDADKDDKDKDDGADNGEGRADRTGGPGPAARSTRSRHATSHSSPPPARRGLHPPLEREPPQLGRRARARQVADGGDLGRRHRPEAAQRLLDARNVPIGSAPAAERRLAQPLVRPDPSTRAPPPNANAGVVIAAAALEVGGEALDDRLGAEVDPQAVKVEAAGLARGVQQRRRAVHPPPLEQDRLAQPPDERAGSPCSATAAIARPPGGWRPAGRAGRRARRPASRSRPPRPGMRAPGRAHRGPRSAAAARRSRR